jgi:hypothetical protein
MAILQSKITEQKTEFFVTSGLVFHVDINFVVTVMHVNVIVVFTII